MQWIVTTLLICAVMAGAFAMYLRIPPSTDEPTFVRQLFDRTGLTGEQLNRRSMQKFSISVEDGIAYVREQMTLIKEKNERLSNYIADQNEKLQRQSVNLRDLTAKLAEKRISAAEFTRMKSVSDALQDQSRILVGQGKELNEMNERIKADMAKLKERMEAVRSSGSSADAADARVMSEKLGKLAEKQQDIVARAENFSDKAGQLTADAKEKVYNKTEQLASAETAMQDSMDKMLGRQNDVLERMRIDQANSDDEQDELKQKALDKAERGREQAEENERKAEDARQRAADLRDRQRR